MNWFRYGIARYGRVSAAVNVAFVTIILAGAAQATSVADVLAAQAALTVPPGMDEAAWRRYRAENEPALQRAHATVTLAHTVEEAVIATHHAAFAQYGRVLVCNLDEESMPSFAALVDRFVADGARLHGMTEAAARPRLLQADIAEMLPVALLSYYRCPAPTAP